MRQKINQETQKISLTIRFSMFVCDRSSTMILTVFLLARIGRIIDLVIQVRLVAGALRHNDFSVIAY